MAVRSGPLSRCPSQVRPKLLFSDVKVDRCVFSGSQQAGNTWQTEALGLHGQGTTMGKTTLQLPKRLQDFTRVERGEMGVVQDQDRPCPGEQTGRNCSESSLLPGALLLDLVCVGEAGFGY